MADALRSGRSSRTGVWVRLPPSAQKSRSDDLDFSFIVSFDAKNCFRNPQKACIFIVLMVFQLRLMSENTPPPSEDAPAHKVEPTTVRHETGEPRIIKRKNQTRGQLSGVQVMFAAILAIGMVLGISLSSRVASSQSLREFYDGVETEIAQFRFEQARLIDERNFAQSDAFVEQWARGEGKMVRPGEILVVPEVVGGGGAATTDNSQPNVFAFADVETTLPEPEPWELWWSLFFDSPPPSF